MSVIEIGESQGFPSVINVKRGPELRRYVPERTCRVVENEDGDPSCSECGAHYLCMLDASYCPDCGARVVTGDEA